MDVFRKVIFELAIKAALRKLFAAFPFLGWGPIGWLVGYAVNKAANFIYDELEKVVEFEFLLLKNKSYQREFDKAVTQVKLLERENAPEEEIENAIKKAQEAMAKHVRFG